MFFAVEGNERLLDGAMADHLPRAVEREDDGLVENIGVHGKIWLENETAHAGHSSAPRRCVFFFAKEMDLRAGFAPASAVYDTAASLPMLAESEMAAGA